MRLTSNIWIVVLMPVLFQVSKTMQFEFPIEGYESDYSYVDPATDGSELKDRGESPLTRSLSDLMAVGEVEGCEPIPEHPPKHQTGPPTKTECITQAATPPSETTTCEPTHYDPAAPPSSPSQSASIPSSPAGGGDGAVIPQIEVDQKANELRVLVQHLYVAQARVQLEASEIRKAQAVANTAQQQLEEASNQVRTITATLQNAQQEVAAAAIRAQIAQLQLAAHDQLLFAARQDVDALSSQMVGLQAAEGIVQPKMSVDLNALLNKLRQPLASYDKPTPVPTIVTLPPQFKKPALENNFEYPTGGGGGGENSGPNDGGEGINENNQESNNNNQNNIIHQIFG